MTEEVDEKLKQEISDRTQEIMNAGVAASNTSTADALLQSSISKLEKLGEDDLVEELEEARAHIGKASEELRFKKSEIQEKLDAAKDKKTQVERSNELEQVRKEAEEKLEQIQEQAEKEES